MSTISPSTMALLAEVLNERLKQTGKGYTAEHDDKHQRGELPQAAAAIALAAITRHSDELGLFPPPRFPGSAAVPVPWPGWETITDRPVREAYLVAAAMLLAEIERIDRLRAQDKIRICVCGSLVWWEEVSVDVNGISLCSACAKDRKSCYSQQEESCNVTRGEISFVHQPDTVERFLRERCFFAFGARVSKAALFEAYETWRATVVDPACAPKMTMVCFCKQIRSFNIEQLLEPDGCFFLGLRLDEAAA